MVQVVEIYYLHLWGIIMDLETIREEIKEELTGGVLELELADTDIDKIIYSATRELNRYYNSTRLVTIPYQDCIDTSEYKINSVSGVFRAEGFTTDGSNGLYDPLLASQWQLLSGVGDLTRFQDYIYNFGSWNTMLQIRNTSSTDLAFRFDREKQELYINISSNTPGNITIAYVPILENPSDIVSEFWVDILVRLSLAKTKIILGRLRTYATQSNALWVKDGEMILAEGNAELTDLREKLQANTALIYPVD